ncbi:MAG: hypothetical protein LUM44_21545 [Pyrinomonadaceae bacterium]|nr:hypothetical protein [Pyrinomonadaceae bacterium]
MKKRFLTVLVSLLFSAPAFGQVFTNPTIAPVITPNRIWSDMRVGQIGSQMAADMARNSKTKGKTAVKGKTATAPKTSAVYQKQFAFQRAVNSPLAQKMAETQKANANDTAKVQQIVKYMWGKYETTFADENRRLGMPFNDVASAMTYYIVSSYLYANDIQSLASENSVAVYRQVAEILGKDAEFMKLKPADKQLYAELLITMGGMPIATFEQSRNRKDLTSLGQQNLERLFGSNANNLQITANGIEF